MHRKPDWLTVWPENIPCEGDHTNQLADGVELWTLDNGRHVITVYLADCFEPSTYWLGSGGQV